MLMGLQMGLVAAELLGGGVLRGIQIVPAFRIAAMVVVVVGRACHGVRVVCL